MPQPAPATRTRQLCQQENCPHPRRQRNFRWGTLVVVVALSVLQMYLFPAASPQARLAVIATLTALIVASSLTWLPAARAWFGWGQHTPLPDEREALIDIWARAAVLNILGYAVPYLVIVVMLFVPGNRPLVYAMIGLWAVLTVGPRLAQRWADTRM